MAYQIDDITAVQTPDPLPENAVSQPGYFTDGDPSDKGLGATFVPAWWLNMVQGELVAICQKANIQPDKTNNTQVVTAILTLIQQQGSNLLSSLETALNSEIQRAQNAETGLSNAKVNRSGDTMSGDLTIDGSLHLNGSLNATGAASFQGSVLSQGTFQQGDLALTQPIGATLEGSQFYVQLVNDAKEGTTYGRLVLRDGGGNYYVGLQIDNHGNVTDGQGRSFLSKPEAQAAYLPLSGGNLTGALYSANIFQQGDLALTQPIGATLEGSQFYVQLVNDAKEGTTYGRLVLRDGGGNFHIPIQVDTHDNTTLSGTLNATGAASFQSSVLSQGTFQQGDLQMTFPIGAGFWNMQFFLQLANNAKTGTTTGRLVLKDNGGNYFVALQIDNHGHVTDAQGRDFLTKPEAQAAYLPLSGGNLTGGITMTEANNWGFGRGGGLSSLAMGDGPERFYQQVYRPKGGLTQGVLGVADETGDRQWKLQANGAIVTPSGNTLPEVRGVPGRVVTQYFRITNLANVNYIPFPVAFAASDPVNEIFITYGYGYNSNGGSTEQSVMYIYKQKTTNNGFWIDRSESGFQDAAFDVAVTGPMGASS
ncbi:hypothetical protein GS535_03675 [Saccharibacter sp. EH611]|uniref:hypothetical protein n=1 Tax=unclassified Saccharibacter TaxID=2648722 RepID=UPI00132BC95A|nr:MULTISPECIES: hypothetical protein [unclassified Saccharibacter]MXV35657.1 hypothetical protein [Saccharibacter sp. EH611]MXV65731.1 hypothetical protein [Saccharibacter sp. EH60]